MDAYTLLVVVHVLRFAYWLGADWGVFVTSRYVASAELPVVLLLPVGLQLAA